MRTYYSGIAVCQAALAEYGFTLEEDGSGSQRHTFTEFARRSERGNRYQR